MLKRNSTPDMLLTLLLSFAICAAGATAQTSNKNAFQKLSLDEARAAAAKEGKVVIIDFFTTWCAPCKEMDRTTWKDEKVHAWLQQKAVAIKLDAEKEVKIAEQYRIDSYPTILFLKADGEEIDRMIGSRNPARFLSEATDSLSGKDSLTRAKEELENGKKNSPTLHQRYAEALANRGRHQEALAEFLWCFDEGMQHDAAFAGVRGSFLLMSIASLGRSYPPAIDALRERRDAAEKVVLSGKAKPIQVLDLVNLNNYLKDQAQTLAAYDKLRTMGEASKDARRMMVDYVIDLLLEAKRYDDILESAPDPMDKLNKSIAGYKHQVKFFASRPDSPKDVLAYMKERKVTSGAKYYEALLGTGKNEPAAALAERIIGFDASAKTYATLIKYATRAGAYDAARSLAERGMKSAPKEQLPEIKKAASEIPKSAKAS